MDKYELDKIIISLYNNASEKDAYFGFTYEDDYPHIQANKDGLILFSRQLLKAIRLFEDRKTIEKPTINIEKGDWFFGEDFYNYIEPVYVSRKDFSKLSDQKNKFKNKLYGIIAVLSLIFICMSIVVGIGTMISWIFE